MQQLSELLRKILAWLQAGYPRGVPQQDYYPLLALLAHHLRPEEVSEVVTALQAEHEPAHATTASEVQAAIEKVTNSPALREDVRRVEGHLRDLGWVLDPFEDDAGHQH